MDTIVPNNELAVKTLEYTVLRIFLPNRTPPQMKGIDANRYATKKTIAQGMLDIALLTSNASQLKFILHAGEKHEFYHFMLALVSISICLQVVF